MALIDELKQKRAEHAEKLRCAYIDADYFRGRVANYDTCISALEMEADLIEQADDDDLDTAIAALEPAPAEQAPAQPPSAELRSDLPASEEESRDQFEDEPDVFISILTGDPAISPESGLHGEPESTELDAPASIVDDPELQAAVARAEQALAIDAQTCEPINPHPQPAYVGLQDADLDADYDAMRVRENADKPKLHFSIFGERGNRKLEDVE
jgi:hypothetical protein